MQVKIASHFFFFLLSPCVNPDCTSRKQRKKLLYRCLLDALVAFPTALLGSFSGAGLSALWPGGSTVAWLQDLSTAHQPSTHSAHPSSSALGVTLAGRCSREKLAAEGVGLVAALSCLMTLPRERYRDFWRQVAFCREGKECPWEEG